jgi:hypothetical protein
MMFKLLFVFKLLLMRFIFLQITCSSTSRQRGLLCPSKPSFAEPPSALGCIAKAALTDFPAGLADCEGRCSRHAGADNVPEEPDAASVAVFLTFTGPLFRLKIFST